VKLRTARQIVCQDRDGKTAMSVAKAYGRSVERVVADAKKTIDCVRKRERRSAK
jgi:hypothetical protein